MYSSSHSKLKIKLNLNTLASRLPWGNKQHFALATADKYNRCILLLRAQINGRVAVPHIKHDDTRYNIYN